MRATEMLIPLFFAAGVGLAMATQTAVNSQLLLSGDDLLGNHDARHDVEWFGIKANIITTK